MTAPDIRAGFTSASSAAYDKACPGRHLAQRGQPDDFENRDARTGTLIHEAFAGNTDSLGSLTISDRKTLIQAKKIEDWVVREWFGDFGMADISAAEIQKRAKREVRIWAYIQDAPRHSGQADAFWFSPDMEHACIEDLKSLWGDVPDATKNEQLRDLAAMLYWNFGVQSVSVFINQPNVTWQPTEVTLAKYSATDLDRAHTEMLVRVMASNKLDAKRVVGSQCMFCRAAGTARCPESQLEITKYSDAQGFDMATATPTHRGQWIGIMKRTEKVVKKALEAVKEQLAAGGAGWADGWKLGSGRKVRSLANPESIPEVGGILSELYGDSFQSAMLAACMKLSIPQLEELHARLSGKSGKEAMEEFDGLFSHLIATKESEGSIIKA